MTTVAQEGRRYYLRGLPFEQKERAKSLGCKWDRDASAWWTGKKQVAEQIAGAVNGGQSAPDSERPSQPGSDRPAPGRDQVVAGKAQYKGRTYYVAGKVDRGRTHWDDQVRAITTRDGVKILLVFRDGSKSFWAARSDVQLTKSYTKPQTIGRLLDFADRAKRGEFVGGAGQEYCYHRCPVGGFKCCPENGPCHDCE